MRRTKARWILLPALVAGAAVALLADAPPGEPKAPAEAAASDAASPQTAAVSPGEAGIRVFVDPETGELMGRRPAGAGDRIRPDHWLNTYSGDLLQEELEAGGYKVDLRGRFQTAVVATIDPETDEAEVDCVKGAAAEEPTDE